MADVNLTVLAADINLSVDDGRVVLEPFGAGYIAPLVAAIEAAADAAEAAAIDAAAVASGLSVSTYYLRRTLVAQGECYADLTATKATFRDGTELILTAPLPGVAPSFAAISVGGWVTSASRGKLYLRRRLVEVGTAHSDLVVVAASYPDGYQFRGEPGAVPAIACWGDSLTAGTGGTPFPTALAALTGGTVYNLGVGGQTSRHIVGRQGGIAYLLTVAGNSIASGANSVTAIGGVALAGMASASLDTQFLSTASSNGTYTIKGFLGSVYGTLTRTASGGPPSTTETYTFTPDAGQTVPAATPAQTAFIPDNAYDDMINIFWLGRNNYTSSAQVLSDVAAAVARLRHERFVIMPVINGNYASEYSGQTGYNTIRSIENSLAAAYPRNFLNVRRLLIDKNGGDVNDTVPASIRADNVHLTTTGYGSTTGVAKFIFDFITAKGWL